MRAVEEMVCVMCVGVAEGGIVVMDVIWRRLCVSMIWGREICLFLCKGATSETGKYLFQRSQPTQGGTVWQLQMPANRDQLLS